MKTQAKTNRLFLVTVLVYVFGGSLISRAVPITLSVYQRVLISQFLVFLVPCIHALGQKERLSDYLHIRPIQIRTAILCVLSTLSVYPLLILVNYISQLFVASGTADLSPAMMDSPFFLNLTIIALIPALNEEFLCRGILYRNYQKSSTKTAIFLSAFLFGCLHLNLNQFGYTFLFGIFLSMILLATDSLVATMICHFTLNSISVVMMEVAKHVDLQAASQNQMNSLEAANALLSNPMVQVAITIFSLGIFCSIGIALFVVLYYLIMRWNGRIEIVKETFAKRHRSDEEKANRVKVITPELVIVVIGCFLDMISFEFLY